MPAPTTMTVPFGGSSRLPLCFAAMPGATPKLIYPVLVRKRHAAIAYGLWAYPTAATASFSVKHLMYHCIVMSIHVSAHSTAGQRMSAYLDTSSRHLATTILRTCQRHHFVEMVLQDRCTLQGRCFRSKCNKLCNEPLTPRLHIHLLMCTSWQQIFLFI